MSASAFAAALSEDAGERSGIALDRQQLIDHLPEGNELRSAFGGEDRMMRISSADYADAVGDLLHALGAADQPGMPSITQRLVRRIGREWRSKIDIMKMLEVEAVANHFLRERLSTGKFNQAGFEDDLLDILGSNRKIILEDIMEILPVYLAQSPFFTRTERVKDAVKLTALFASEKLPIDGTFFDQRFINYLSGKPELVQEMHWRQFEGLTAEWLSQQGYVVELGPGRDDGGVDVRAWAEGAAAGTPPAMIVQCKRERGKVGKVVVKALWADVYAEKASSGLIVTTNDVSPGAAKVIEARAYPVTVANGAQVRNWVSAMRKPAAGIVL